MLLAATTASIFSKAARHARARAPWCACTAPPGCARSQHVQEHAAGAVWLHAPQGLRHSDGCGAESRQTARRALRSPAVPVEPSRRARRSRRAAASSKVSKVHRRRRDGGTVELFWWAWASARGPPGGTSEKEGGATSPKAPRKAGPTRDGPRAAALRLDDGYVEGYLRRGRRLRFPHPRLVAKSRVRSDSPRKRVCVAPRSWSKSSL